MTDDLRPPYRIAFDNARDPYAARNALGIAGTGAGLITSVTAPLSVTGGNLTIDLTGYGNVSNSGTPVTGQIAEWVTATTIKGVTLSSQLDTRSLFRAVMSADQTGFSAGTYFPMLFNTAGQNVGGHYNTTTQRWTPPAGRVMLACNIFYDGGVVGGAVRVALYKNGALFVIANTSCPSAFGQGSLTIFDVANGTDYYSIYVQFTAVAGGGGLIYAFPGGASTSWFSGALL